MKITRTVEMTNRLSKVGRNDPCPCNSGKKYKKCCLLKKTTEAPVSAGNTRDSIAKLHDWALKQDWYEKQFAALLQKTYGKSNDLTDKELQTIEEILFFEIKVKKDKTPLELYASSGLTTSKELDLYNSWIRRNKFEAYITEEIFLGKGLRVKELSGEKRYLISDHLASYSLQKGTVLATRILPFPGGHIFAGGYSVILPEALVHTLNKHHQPLNMTAFEYMSSSRGEKKRDDQTPEKTYEQLKQELSGLILKKELPFDMTGFDERIKQAKNITAFFYPVYLAAFKDDALMEKINGITLALWTKFLNKEESLRKEAIEKIGVTERTLINDFANYCGGRFEREEITNPDEQMKLSAKWREIWLIKPQKALGGHIPKDVILRERQKMGNTDTEFNYASTGMIWLKRWDKASGLHFKGLDAFRANDIPKTLNYYTQVVKKYPDFPFIYRSLANLGMAHVALGDKQEGLRLLKKACSLNPNYRFAKEQLERIQKMPEKKILENAAAINMKQSLGRLLKMIQKTKERRRKKEII